MSYTDKEKAKDTKAIGEELMKLAINNKQAKMIRDLQEGNIRLKDRLSGRNKKNRPRSQSYPGLKQLGSKPSTPV
jgi:hypothetical protein